MVREIPVFYPSGPAVAGGPSGWLRVVDSTAPSTNESVWCQAAQGGLERVVSARDHELLSSVSCRRRSPVVVGLWGGFRASWSPVCLVPLRSFHSKVSLVFVFCPSVFGLLGSAVITRPAAGVGGTAISPSGWRRRRPSRCRACRAVAATDRVRTSADRSGSAGEPPRSGPLAARRCPP